MIGSTEPEICTKMLRKFCREKLTDRAKFPAATCGYSMHGKILNARLHHAFSEFFELEASQVKGQSLQIKDKKSRKRKGEKNRKKNEKLQDVGHFLV